MRLILPSFAILAFIFYEMSGGADFKPPQPPAPVVADTQAEPPVTRARVVAEPVKRPETPATVRVTPVLAEEPVATGTPATEKSNADLDQVRTSLSAGLTLVPDSGPAESLRLVSLELGASGLSSVANPEPAEDTDTVARAATTDLLLAEPERDLREVTGTRVNMRDGPGTIYPVIARLNIGHQVEVLSESGTGWLRLRVLPEGQLGWISASLISKSAP